MIDNTEEQMMWDNNGIVYEPLAEDLWEHIDYGKVFHEYAKLYTTAFAKEAGIKLEFEELVSPKDYNFTTDRIFAKISRTDVAKMLWAVRGDKLNKIIKERFTSRSGFISYYSNDIKDWGKVDTWDHNQIGTILMAYADVNEEYLMEDFICNGELDDIVYCAADKEAQLAFNFASILRSVFS